MADLLYPALWQVFDANGDPVPGAKASFYDTGTTTPKTVYYDSDMVTPATQPVVADGAGAFPQLFTAGGVFKVVVTDANDGALYTLDPVMRNSAGGAGASEISFSPTVALPFTDVQSAIEGAVAAAASGYNAFGLGETGSTVLLANLDATGTASGAYRFDGTTTGTFPAGVSASDAGVVEIWRQASGSARMWVFPSNTDRAYMRRLASASWGTWREEIHVNTGAAEGDIIYRGASAWTRLAKGAAGQSLVMNSGATAPEWAGSGIGVGQTWQNPTRVKNTVYTNDTGKPIQVAITKFANDGAQNSFEVNDGVAWETVGTTSTGAGLSVFVIIPPGHTYRATGSATTWNTWKELR